MQFVIPYELERMGNTIEDWAINIFCYCLNEHTVRLKCENVYWQFLHPSTTIIDIIQNINIIDHLYVRSSLDVGLKEVYIVNLIDAH